MRSRSQHEEDVLTHTIHNQWRTKYSSIHRYQRLHYMETTDGSWARRDDVGERVSVHSSKGVFCGVRWVSPARKETGEELVHHERQLQQETRWMWEWRNGYCGWMYE